MTLKTIKTKDLKVGMYVKLGRSWLKHSFLLPNFKITSEKQIKRILANGIKSVQVDLSKSDVVEDGDRLKDSGTVDHLEKETSSGKGKADAAKSRAKEDGDRLKDPGTIDHLEKDAPSVKGKADAAKISVKGDGDGLKAPGHVDHLEKEAATGEGEADAAKTSVKGETRLRIGEARDLLKDLGQVNQEDGPALETREDPGRKQGDIARPEAGEFNPIDLVSEELRETIENTSLPPKTKAKAVYNHSVKMMNHMLENPSAENILSGKKMVYAIVDHILADDETAAQMTKITSHDYYTYTHSVNVGMLAVLLTKSALKGTIATHNMHELGAGFFLHDLGKCDVPVSLINKPDVLSPEEWKLMRAHPAKGNKLLSDTHNLSKETGVIIMQHHEREDGSGYPFGLKGHEIHFYGRICSIADVYDALTSTRAYKKKLPPVEALGIMKKEMIHHFHRDLFGVFLTLFE